MKRSNYEVLQVSQKALPAVIDAAYNNLKPVMAEAASRGDEDARNELLFVEEAYLVLSDPVRRVLYDESLVPLHPSGSHQIYAAEPSPYEPQSIFLDWWQNAKTSRFLVAIGIFVAVFFVYKFVGQQGDHKIATKHVEAREKKEIGAVNNDGYRAETERTLIQGVVQNQAAVIDRSYDIQEREAERRRTELEYRANAGAQQLDMRRQEQEARLQEQKWRQDQYEKDRKIRQEQYEKDRQVREASAVVARNRRELCNIYRSQGRIYEAQANGC